MKISKGFDNSLVLNVSKTQAMLISRRDRGVVVEHPPTVAGDVVVFSDSVKNLGLYIDNRLSWREQVSRVVSRTYSTLRLLYRFQRYTSRDLRIYLVRSLYTDVVFFPCSRGWRLIGSSWLLMCVRDICLVFDVLII
jgi:hypothetical protein